jgi:signal transduction histidine kinase
MLDGNQVRVLDAGGGLNVGNVLAISGRGPDVWVGGEFGLQRYVDGRLRTIVAADEEMLRGTSGIIERANGDLWLNTGSGIFHIDQQEIQKSLQGETDRVTGQYFGVRDGLPGVAAQVRPLGGAVEGTDGRLWFAAGSGLVWLDPERAQHAAAALPVTIQSVLADDHYYDPDTPLRFAPHTSMVQFNYAAMSLSSPETVRYRYRLEGTDAAWREVRVPDAVTYRNLPPGTYHFRVEASNTNGTWTGREALAEFTILPAFYQTRAFLVLCFFGAVGFAYVAGRVRVRQVTQTALARMQERITERERIARDLHDTLLQSVQGLILTLHGVTRKVSNEDARSTIEKTLDQAERTLVEGRDRVRELRGAIPTLDDLPAALGRLAEQMPQTRGTRVNTVVAGGVRELHPIVLDESYSIGREAIVNALTHSGGRRVDVEIVYGRKQFRLRVRDDGGGIDPRILAEGGRADHWGLRGMRERAARIGAQLRIRRSDPGTEVELVIPGAAAYPSARSGSLRRWLSFARNGAQRTRASGTN